MEYKTSVVQSDDTIVKMVREIEKNYKNNFKAQAALFKRFFDNIKDDENKLELIKDFVSKKKSSTRQEVLNKVLKDTKEYKDVLYLGIPSDLGRKYNSVQDNAKAIINLLQSKKDNISHDLLKNININLNATTTTILYLFCPEKFIPIAGNMNNFLIELNIIDNKKKIDNWEDYFKVLDKLRDKFPNMCSEDKNEEFKPSFTIALSFASWLLENSVENILDKFLNNENKPKNIILTGIPGTGKTHAVKEYVDKKEIEHEFVQFHPSYDYEDFIEGLKPVPSENGQISFKLVDGPFKKLCKKAFADKDNTYVMIIDEINRANLSRVFGELLYCLEYRGEFVSTKMTTYIDSLPDDNDKKEHSIDENHIGKFTIPENVIVLGTMNEVDRSIDAFDLALRRRFIWEDIGFSETALRLYQPFFQKNFQKNIDALIKKSTTLNEQLSKDIGANYQLGHTYYFKIIDYFDGDFNSALCDLWEYHIKSIVREYCKIKYGEHEIEAKLNEYRKIIVDKNSCDG